jgi:hypothetical protein
MTRELLKEAALERLFSIATNKNGDPLAGMLAINVMKDLAEIYPNARAAILKIEAALKDMK